MNTVAVVVFPESQQLVLKGTGIPEKYVIKTFPPDCPDEAFDEWVRYRHAGHGLDLLDLKDSEVGLPAMEFEQRVMIAAEIAG